MFMANMEFIRKLLFIGKKLNSRKKTKKVYLTKFKRKLSQLRNKAIIINIKSK